jgi:hypothetical protein
LNPALIAQILQILLTAEPAVVEYIHGLLSGKVAVDDTTTLNQDVIDWQAVQAKAKAELGITDTPAPTPTTKP